MDVVYQDIPKYDRWLKVLLAFPLAIILIPGLWSVKDEPEAAYSLAGIVVLMLVIYWVVLPRRYCVFSNKVQIILGTPFSFNVPFETIKAVGNARGMILSVNFPTSFSSKRAVQISRKRRLSLVITPNDPERFMENLNRALDSWRSYNIGAR